MGVSAGVHLDHAAEEADVRAAIDAGFSSVMYDGAEKPLTPLTEMLAAAASRGGCLSAFDSGGGRTDYIIAVLTACRELDAPALFLGWCGAAKSFGFKPLATLVRSLADEMGVSAGVHLDHAAEEADVRAAIDAGFSSVMYDGAEKPLSAWSSTRTRRASPSRAPLAASAARAAATRASSPTPPRPSASGPRPASTC